MIIFQHEHTHKDKKAYFQMLASVLFCENNTYDSLCEIMGHFTLSNLSLSTGRTKSLNT